MNDYTDEEKQSPEYKKRFAFEIAVDELKQEIFKKIEPLYNWLIKMLKKIIPAPKESNE